MHYKFSILNPSSHYLEIEVNIDGINANEITIQLSACRPGRYELGNFAKNIKKLEFFDESSNLLSSIKISKDAWRVNTTGVKKVKVTYAYFANDLNAGSTYVSPDQMYVNPVNCCVFVKEKMEEEHTIELDVPKSYAVATSLTSTSKNKFSSKNFDEFADSPFIASEHIQSKVFDWNGVKFHLHFNGECIPDWEKLERDFKKFVHECVEFFGEIHLKEYHFLFQILPFRFYHGVEHVKSTVITLGPGYAVMNDAMYNELLGVSCHELFHTWNVKTIRPKEMLPYDFTKENYARTGFVYEGITTYYGDKLLFTSGVFSEQQYFHTLEERLLKHFHNGGRQHLSLADSSFDTWLDGYVPGAPHRKVSIYDEGNLVAFMLDVLIIKHSDKKYSLKDVMRKLYTDFYKKGIGYTESDITAIASAVAGKDLTVFFNDYIYSTKDYEQQLHECFSVIGWSMKEENSPRSYERLLGIKGIDLNGFFKITSIASDSISSHSLQMNDEIISVNGCQVKNDLHHWLNYFSLKGKNISLQVIQNAEVREVNVILDLSANYFPIYKIQTSKSVDKAQESMRTRWMKN